jgi:non-canonical (house-cleaning) NTP pyrophosphatase
MKRILLLGLALLPACSTFERSLIFTTHTTVGLGVSVGQAADSPVNLTIGYERFEGVLNPVYDESGIDNTKKKYRDEAYSVIAKFEGDIKASAQAAAPDPANTSKPGGGTSGAVVASQWFATGEAATLLAKERLTSVALTDSPQVANALAAASLRSGDDEAVPQLAAATIAVAHNVVASLRELAADGDLDAIAVMADLDKRVRTVAPIEHSTEYAWDATANKLTGSTIDATPFKKAEDLVLQWGALRRSAEALKQAEAYLTANSTVSTVAYAVGPEAGVMNLSSIATTRSALVQCRAQLSDALSSTKEYPAAVGYFLTGERR